jgi:hypothetical protein
MAHYRTDELIGLLMYEVKGQQTDGIASTEDVMPAAANYICSEFGEAPGKVVADSVRWALIYMCDDLGVLERPFGKLDDYAAKQRNRAWLRRYRPRQNTKQQLWRLSDEGSRIL